MIAGRYGGVGAGVKVHHGVGEMNETCTFAVQCCTFVSNYSVSSTESAGLPNCT